MELLLLLFAILAIQHLKHHIGNDKIGSSVCVSPTSKKGLVWGNQCGVAMASVCCRTKHRLLTSQKNNKKVIWVTWKNNRE